MTASPNTGTGYTPNKRLLRDPALILAFLLLGIALFCKLTQGREIVPNEFIFSRSLLSNAGLTQEQPPIDIGALGESGDHSAILVRLDFKISETSDHPNLLQTDSLNRGLRLELSGRTLAMIVGSPIDGTPYQVFVLSTNLPGGKWHNLTLRIVATRYVDIKIDGSLVGPTKFDIPFSMQNVRIGIGYDDTRRFHGDMENIDIRAGSSPLFGIWLAILNVRFFWYAGLFLAVFVQRSFVYYPPLPTDARRLAALKREAQKVRPTTLVSPAIYLSILLNLVAILYLVAKRHFLQESEIVIKTLLPGFDRLNGAPPFNSTLLIFILVEMSLVGTLAMCWLMRLLGAKRLNLLSRNIIVAAICILSASLFFVFNGIVSRLLVLCATVLPLIALIPWSGTLDALPNAPLVAALAILRRTYYPLQLVTNAIKSSRAAESLAILTQNSPLSPIIGKGLAVATGILLCSVLAWPVFQAWFPVVIPNDYLESADFFQIKNPSGTADISRNEIAECLRILETTGGGGDASATKEPSGNFNCRGFDLPKNEWNRLGTSLSATADWQGEVGRTLFHHSYIFVPARHFLAYGFDQAVPYLYGYGNTVFHALLMQLNGGATLSSYFTTFPIAELVGMSAIALLVLLVTRSSWLAISGFALSLIAFYSINYVTVFLAASFSPARYLGLLLQLASICVCCRTPASSRFLLLPLAAATSLFWNTEFAFLGLVGQALLTIAPGLRLTLTQRALLLASLFVCPLAYAIVVHASPDIVNTVQLSFFNVGMPFMSRPAAAWFFTDLIAAEVLLFCLSMLFSGNERTLRLCYLPILALLMVKFIYNPAAPHLYLVFTLVWPILLLYLPAPGSIRHFTPVFGALVDPRLVAAITVSFAVMAGLTYNKDAVVFRGLFMNDFVVSKWGILGESIGFVTPEKTISERVESIKKQLSPQDTLIILSPFDQILNFYVNPPLICGHFDLLSNLATQAIENAVLACATRSPRTLIVYDRASETPCPTGYFQTESRCALRAATKGNLTDLRNRLLPFVKLVGSDENLLFYRPTLSAQGANAPIRCISHYRGIAERVASTSIEPIGSQRGARDCPKGAALRTFAFFKF